jgi:hypothetical protein
MADIRIKDLTTLESASLTGDVFVIDGTTGTRKLSAFSPTFGGNATVTGTLTVNGASTLTGATTIGGDSSNGNYLSYNSDISGFCGLWMRQSSKSATNYVLASNGTSGTLVNATGASLFLRIENTTALEINTSRNVLIPTTTASTTTSTGALVVGNGTSGGLGVGGSVNVGGSLTVSGTSSLLTVANSTGSAMLAVFASAYASGSATPYVVIGSFSDPATSGARIAVSTDYSLDNRAAIQLQTRTTAGTLQTALTLANTGNATFLGSVTTGAPSGGTAAAWKLGTVATVSPTSPNRTIEVDIGGTIYYLAAKTTNN